MTYNYNFGRLENGSIKYAPSIIKDGCRYVVCPTANDYAACNWLPIVDKKPSEPPPEGYRYIPTGWKEESGSIVRIYTAVVIIPAARTFSKLKLYGALVKAGLWDALVAWLQSQSVEGINAYTAFTLAQDISDNHPLFKEYYQAARLALGLSEEQAEAILNESVEV